MITLSTTGRVTADLELKISTNQNPYLRFNIAVNKGFGEKQHAVFLQCWLYNEQAQRMINAGVKKGSLIQIAGDMDIVEYEKKDGSIGTIPKVTLFDWNYGPISKAKDEGAPNSSTSAASSSPQGTGQNGRSAAGFDEIDCEDNDLPL